jgi:hypothetical protein
VAKTETVKLTPQREKFAYAIVAGMTQADAYRHAYPKSRKVSPRNLYAEASRLAANPKVFARIAQLREPAVESAQLTLSGHLAELDRLKRKAEKCDQHSAAIRAEELRGKATGLYVEKHHHSGHVGTGINPEKLKSLPPKKLDALIALLEEVQ